jgi:hypothetical protein
VLVQERKRGGGGRNNFTYIVGMLTNEERKYVRTVLKNFIIISDCTQENERNKT